MTLESKDYYICYIDLLGQKEFFKQIKSTEVDDDTAEHIDRVAAGLSEAVRYIKNRYGRFFIKDDDVGVELFSDSILLSLKVSQDGFGKFKAWLDIIIKVVYIVCKYHLPFRGCITIGKAARSERGFIYGMAVHDAEEIEETLADYPRVLLSRKLVDECEACDDIKPYFALDVDAATVLNYAGRHILARLDFRKESALLVSILAWVQERYNHYCYFQDEDHDKFANPKLARKYVMWLDYLHRESGIGEEYDQH